MNRDHLLTLAERCETGAAQLDHDAEHAAQLLPGRGWSDADAERWAADKRAAAAAARHYAQGLRAEAAGMGEDDQPSQARIEQAQKVADAATLGGTLIDGSRLSEAAAAHPLNSAEMRQAIEEDQRAKTEAVEGSGMFTRVAEPGRVPYWQLRPPQDTSEATTGPAPQPARTAEDADGDEM
jgi:hypothetical protein